MSFSNSRRNFVLLIVFVLCASVPLLGQKQMTGSWKAKVKTNSQESIHISFYSEDSGKDHQHGSSFKLERLQGLSMEQINAASAPVNFSITSEAGDIAMTGTFQNGAGSGSFLFTPNTSFSAAVQSLDFKNVKEKELFASAVLDVKLSTVSELRNSGIEVTDYDDVIKATIFKIDGTYISEMSAAGFETLDMEGLVQGKIFKIDAEYARQVVSMGFGKKSFDELVQFRIFKVTPEFLTQMQAEGFSELSADQVVQMRIFKIDSNFINDMRAKGYANPTIEELVQLRIRGKID